MLFLHILFISCLCSLSILGSNSLSKSFGQGVNSVLDNLGLEPSEAVNLEVGRDGTRSTHCTFPRRLPYRNKPLALNLRLILRIPWPHQSWLPTPHPLPLSLRLQPLYPCYYTMSHTSLTPKPLTSRSAKQATCWVTSGWCVAVPSLGG